MELMLAVLLIIIALYAILFTFRAEVFGIKEMHLPSHVFDQSNTDISNIGKPPRKKSWVTLTTKFKGFENRLPFPIDGINRKLIRAGSPMGVLEFLAFKLFMVIAVPMLGLTFGAKLLPPHVMLMFSLLAGYLIPDFWLNSTIKKRQARIRKDLPNIIDLLNLCVSGGMDFMLAVNRVVRDLKPCDLTAELSEVYRETQVGKSRREALKNFAWRLDMPEVHSFVRTLVQADRMGSPMAEGLNLQAEEMRVRRFQNGESMALKAPIKLLFPLFAFILPVVLIIVGGPIILQFVKGTNVGF